MSKAQATLPATAAKPAVILGYSASWGDAAYPPSAYDYSGLTHIARSFLAPHADGTITNGSDFWSDELEKGAHAHGVKLLASVGGSAENANEWLGMARDPAAKKRFFDTLDSLITAHHYDGVDIDWEPSALNDADQQAYTSFMVSLRQRFPSWQLSTALGGSDWWARHVSWREVSASVDFIDLMTYTFAGSWSGHSGHNANLFPASSYGADGADVDTILQGLLKKYGVPPEKIVLGLAFYGAQYSTDKMGQNFPPNSRYKGEEINYAEVTRLAATPEYKSYWDEGGHVPYLERVGGGHTVSFDDPRSINEKCVYAVHNGLRGVMFWYMGEDLVRGEPVLEHALERSYGLASPTASREFLRTAYLAHVAEVERISTELEREIHDLERADPAQRGRFEDLSVKSPELAEIADEKALNAALLDIDQKLGRLDVRRADVQRALSTMPPAKGRSLAFNGPVLSVDGFEGQGLSHGLGGNWSASFDKNSLGTVFNPQPTAWASGGHATEHALHLWGHFGKSRAPWPFAALVADFEPTDFSTVQALRFWAKGNNKQYAASLHRLAVHDYAFPSAAFSVTGSWSLVELPLADFKQPNWGQKL
ncbi:MAG TPA: glycoside hydrolase family 18 protein, partial [Polyangiaceae bacterium]|nr:glycoside hydrolase family 18 protein [Polyangiaceae bacterium]